MKGIWRSGNLRNEKGVTIIMVAGLMVVFLGLAALAIDLGHLYIVKNELQNAADAGALAGARVLYTNNGQSVNANANAVATAAAVGNRSEGAAVEVQAGDVERGHWSFTTKTFTPNVSLAPAQLDRTTQYLDTYSKFINAVRVTTRREATPAASFFAKIFGYQNFVLHAQAIAYLGFAGTLLPHQVDEPIAICDQYLLLNGAYTCSVGRMINFGNNPETRNTATWTNFSQPCTNPGDSDLSGLVCAGGNPHTITLGEGVGTNGDMIQDVFNALYDCWNNNAPDTNHDGIPDKKWSLTLAVVDCGSLPNPNGCLEVVGVVNVDVLWMTGNGPNNNIPLVMEGWSCSTPGDSAQCWNSFVTRFNIKNGDGNPATDDKSSIYFLPDCTPHIPTGRTGGRNFGILAEIPALVR